MGLLGKKSNKDSKEEKKYAIVREKMKNRGLGDLSDEYADLVKYLFTMEEGMFLQDMAFGKSEKDYLNLTQSRLNLIEEQNWIIIKLLNEISQKLDK